MNDWLIKLYGKKSQYAGKHVLNSCRSHVRTPLKTHTKLLAHALQHRNTTEEQLQISTHNILHTKKGESETDPIFLSSAHRLKRGGRGDVGGERGMLLFQQMLCHIDMWQVCLLSGGCFPSNHTLTYTFSLFFSPPSFFWSCLRQKAVGILCHSSLSFIMVSASLSRWEKKNIPIQLSHHCYLPGGAGTAPSALPSRCRNNQAISQPAVKKLHN